MPARNFKKVEKSVLTVRRLIKAAKKSKQKMCLQYARIGEAAVARKDVSNVSIANAKSAAKDYERRKRSVILAAKKMMTKLRASPSFARLKEPTKICLILMTHYKAKEELDRLHHLSHFLECLNE